MKEKKSNFGLNVSRLLFCFIAIYFIFFSEKGQQRFKNWLNLLEFSNKRISHSNISQTNLEKEFEKKEMEKIILVEVPKTIYPEIRETLCYLFEKSGFKNVNLQKEINFEKLYENKKS